MRQRLAILAVCLFVIVSIAVGQGWVRSGRPTQPGPPGAPGLLERIQDLEYKADQQANELQSLKKRIRALEGGALPPVSAPRYFAPIRPWERPRPPLLGGAKTIEEAKAEFSIRRHKFLNSSRPERSRTRRPAPRTRTRKKRTTKKRAYDPPWDDSVPPSRPRRSPRRTRR